MTEKTLPSTLPRLARWRTSIQASFLVVWLFPFIRIHSICSPVFHCYACPLASFACPIGVMAQFGALHLIPFLAIGTVIFVGALFGAFVCGYACPFGFLQDLIGKIPTPKFHLPRWSGYLRYAVLLGLVVIVPFFFGEGHPLFICRVCPAGALEASVPNVVKQAVAGETISWPNAAKIIILVLFFVAMFVKMRPWCRILCPLGGIFGLFNRASAIYMRTDPAKCNSCKLCRTECEYGVIPETELQSTRCIRCMECAGLSCNAVSATTVFSKNKRPSGSDEEKSTAD